MKAQHGGQMTAKILILGESKVGKSSLLLRFTENKFLETVGPTLGIDYRVHTLDIDSKKIHLQLWDTAGQERFKSITESYYRGAHGILLVFDVEDQRSFKRISKWMENIRDNTPEKDLEQLSVVLVGKATFIYKYFH